MTKPLEFSVTFCSSHTRKPLYEGKIIFSSSITFLLTSNENNIQPKEIYTNLIKHIYKAGPDILLLLKTTEFYVLRANNDADKETIANKLIISNTFGEIAPQTGKTSQLTLSSASDLMIRWDLNESDWRISNVNQNGVICSSYPQSIIVPITVSDILIKESAKFRSEQRFPLIAYYHKETKAVLLRSGQPMTGQKGRRCIEDEQLVRSFFSYSSAASALSNDASPTNLLHCIIESRTKSNAQQARLKGGGSEVDSFYGNAKLLHSNIESVPFIADTFQHFLDVFYATDLSSNKYLLESGEWMRQVQAFLRPAGYIAKAMSVDKSSVLLHCDTGREITSTVVSLAKVFLCSYYRSIDGLYRLIDEDWCSVGFPFGAFGYRGKIENDKIICFQMFIVCLQIAMAEYPTEFEYTLQTLVEFQHAVFSRQYINFVCDSEIERVSLQERMKSLWDTPLSSPANPMYVPSSIVLIPNASSKQLHLFDFNVQKRMEFLTQIYNGFTSTNKIENL